MGILQPYKKYYPIDYDYAKALPEGWQLLPNIAIFQERIERGTENEEALTISAIRGIVKSSDYENRKDRTSDDKSQYLLVKEGDLAYNTMLMWDGAVGHSSFRGIVSPAYTVLKAKIKINPKFFHFQMRCEFYKNYSRRFSYGIVDARLRLYYVYFKRMYSIVPPLKVQNSIVAYLDKKNNEIEKFIRNKERLIGLLEENFRSKIFDLTLGKNLDIPKSDSTFYWIGAIPQEWKIIKIRRNVSEHKQGYYTTDQYINSGVKLLRISDLLDNSEIDYENMPHVTISKKDFEFFKIKEGDFIFARTGSIGQFGYVQNPEEVVFASYLIRFRFSKHLNKDFIRFVLRSKYFKDGLLMSIHGGVNQNVHAENIKDQYIIIPNNENQIIQIVTYLKNEEIIINEAIMKAQKEISSIKEYREALITDLVTGKRQVPASFSLTISGNNTHFVKETVEAYSVNVELNKNKILSE